MRSGPKAILHRAAVKSLSFTGGLERAMRSLASEGLPVVLTFHRIVPDDEFKVCRSPRGMVLREGLFRELLSYLKDATDVLSLSEISYVSSDRRRPRVLLTFDDGWADNAEVALPHLSEYRLRGCFFVATDLVGHSNPFWPERVQRLLSEACRLNLTPELQGSLQILETSGSGPPPRISGPASDERVLTWLKQFSGPALHSWATNTEALLSSPAATGDGNSVQDTRERMMTWDQLRALIKAGHSVGSHTSTHAILSGLSPEQVAHELLSSKRALEEQLSLQPNEANAISYPNGWASSKEAEAAYGAGYRVGFTTAVGVCQPSANQLLLPRVNVWDGTVTGTNGTFCEEQLRYALFWKPLHAPSKHGT